jgi:hypothetical protein
MDWWDLASAIAVGIFLGGSSLAVIGIILSEVFGG